MQDSREISAEPYYTFPAIRGIQAGREYYVTMCQLKLIPKIFSFDEEGDVPAELRAQRTMNKGRIPALSRYILENPGDYIFSSLTASIDGDVKFTPFDESAPKDRIGELKVPMSARIIINDGQHRRAAIEQAIRERSDLGFDTISVVFFVDAGLKKSQQMFADLNQHAVRPTKSLGIFYDHRDPFSRFNVRLVDKVPIFRNRVELEKISISNRSLKFFTLSAVYQANRSLLGKKKVAEKVTEEEEALATTFWTAVTEHIPEWKLLLRDKVSPDELRRDYINAHGIALHALGIAGHSLLKEHPKDWQKVLKRLEKINWSRSNSAVWEGRATIAGGVSKARNNLMLTSNLLKKTLGLQLSKEEQRMEAIYETTKKERR